MKYIKKFESYLGNERTPEEIANEWSGKEGNNFFNEFLNDYPSKEDFEQRLEDYRDRDNPIYLEDPFSTDDDEWAGEGEEIYMLETEFNSFPGEDSWNGFISDLYKSSWGADHEDRLPDWMK